MTREEAIEYIKTNCYGEYCEDDWRNAMDMAIRSLEAWDNLVKEMEEEMYYYDTIPDVWYGISKSFDIIKKHLKEVEDERIHSADVVEVVMCNECKYYDGVHGVMGHAPCSFWKSGGVMWDDFCRYGERREQ